MLTGLLRVLSLAAWAALGTVASASAATAIASCAVLSATGATYVLTDDLTSCGTCLVVAANRITIDLAGHAISGDCGGDGVTDGGTARHGTTVKNGRISGFEFGFSLGSSTRTQILNVTSSANSAIGINVGPRSLVKGCVVEDNGETGILIGDFGQVQDCTISGHDGGSGIFGASHLLVKDNWLEKNVSGIVVGDFGTVAFNTSNQNVFIGVLAGSHSLVTGNTTNENRDGIITAGFSSVSHNTSNANTRGGIAVGLDGVFDGTHGLITGNTTNGNGEVGLEAWCPSTVTNNKSSGNGSDNYDINGSGCQTKNNN